MTEKTVLIVEDNILNMKLVRDVLRIDKFKSIEADNAEAGLELARLNEPDLILMDIELPGMDGLSAMRLIKADPALRHIPVLALTAYAMEDDKINAKSAGCDGYITKPINIKRFRETISNYLGNSDEPVKKPERASLADNTDKCCFSKKILIVDDDTLNVKLLSVQLATKGYQVLKAYDGMSALEAVQKNNPDLILLDIMMPGMDGYEVTSRLKSDSSTRDIPIILVTALTGEDDKKKGLDAGADEFINKPIDYPELDARIISLLRLKEYQEQLGSRKKSEELVINGSQGKLRIIERERNLPTVLVADDDPVSIGVMKRFLSKIPCNIEMALSGEETIRCVQEKKIDVILLDLMLPNMNGFEVCQRIKGSEETCPIQVVMITNLTDTASKLKGIESGTDDFLVKPVDKDELKARLIALFKKKAYLDQLIARIDTALNAAITDRLTGVFNYGYFRHFIEMEFQRAKRQDSKLALLMIDVDDFKQFNDRYGHPCGDHALKIVASTLQENIRKVDFLARYGGEEFAVILPYVGRNAAEEIAERLIRKVGNHAEIEGTAGARLSISIGLSMFPDQVSSAEELIRTADTALYMAKRNGKNRVEPYSKINKPAYSGEICRAGLL